MPASRNVAAQNFTGQKCSRDPATQDLRFTVECLSLPCEEWLELCQFWCLGHEFHLESISTDSGEFAPLWSPRGIL